MQISKGFLSRVDIRRHMACGWHQHTFLNLPTWSSFAASGGLVGLEVGHSAFFRGHRWTCCSLAQVSTVAGLTPPKKRSDREQSLSGGNAQASGKGFETSAKCKKSCSHILAAEMTLQSCFIVSWMCLLVFELILDSTLPPWCSIKKIQT